MTADEQRQYPVAAALDLTLYHVTHPMDPDRDEWTQNYVRARAYFVQFTRDYGTGAHLHIETFHANQYEARCMMRADATPG